MKRGIRIEGSTIVVTGASSGIGRALALRLATRGANLVLASRRGSALDELARECGRRGARALPVPTDVTDYVQVVELGQLAEQEFGRIDAWVNDAGVYLLGAFDGVPLSTHRRLLDVNLGGVLNGSRVAVDHFRRQGGGVLVNLASQAGRAPYKLASSYCASKAAVRGFSEALRQELRDGNIDVCAVLPPSVDTPLYAHAANYTGHAMRPLPPVYDVERVARAIERCLERPRGEVVIGAAPRLLSLWHAVARPLYDRALARATPRLHLLAEPAPPGDGNLFTPSPWTATTGGWKRRRLAAGALALLAGVGAWWQRERLARLLRARAATA